MFDKLTDREIEVIEIMSTISRPTNKNIAHYLNCSENTVRTHLHSVFIKTGAKNRTELAARYIREKMEDATASV